MQTTTFTLSDDRRARVEALVDPAIRFLDQQKHPMGSALSRYLWRGGPASEVVTALAAFQNPDGGFGRGLEVDIKAPVSNPFATRIAMHVLTLLPPEETQEMRAALGDWLVANQAEDGDWHFAPAVREHDLAPWFAGWTFPSLNPACCLAGLANELGIATPEVLERVAGLFARLASPDEARNGAFYAALPYVEYIGRVAVPDRHTYLDALAEGIAAREYEDAGHFFEHALGGGRELSARIPADRFTTEADRLMDEVSKDGGWPTPYDPAWRPWTTTMALVTLARLRDGV